MTLPQAHLSGRARCGGRLSGGRGRRGLSSRACRGGHGLSSGWRIGGVHQHQLDLRADRRAGNAADLLLHDYRILDNPFGTKRLPEARPGARRRSSSSSGLR